MKTLLIFLCMLCSIVTNTLAQYGLDFPYSFDYPEIDHTSTDIPTYSVPQYNLDSARKTLQDKIGVRYENQNIDFIKSAKKICKDGRVIYLMRFYFPHSKGITLLFNPIYLPLGSKLYMYSNYKITKADYEKNKIRYLYPENERYKRQIEHNVNPLVNCVDSLGILELNMPDSISLDSLNIIIDKIQNRLLLGDIDKELKKDAPCLEDGLCFTNLKNQVSSIVKILNETQNNISSGVLINNELGIDNRPLPLILTCSHTNYDNGNSVIDVIFPNIISCCGDANIQAYPVIQESTPYTLIYDNGKEYTDIALLKLETLDSDIIDNLYYSGWTTVQDKTNLYPQTLFMKADDTGHNVYMATNGELTASDYVTYTTFVGNYTTLEKSYIIQNADYFKTGSAAYPGASGAPLFTSTGYVMGITQGSSNNGINNPCNEDNIATYYGSFRQFALSSPAPTISPLIPFDREYMDGYYGQSGLHKTSASCDLGYIVDFDERESIYIRNVDQEFKLEADLEILANTTYQLKWVITNVDDETIYYERLKTTNRLDILIDKPGTYNVVCTLYDDFLNTKGFVVKRKFLTANACEPFCPEDGPICFDETIMLTCKIYDGGNGCIGLPQTQVFRSNGTIVAGSGVDNCPECDRTRSYATGGYDVRITDVANVEFYAEEEIILRDGFWAISEYSSFSAVIAPCNHAFKNNTRLSGVAVSTSESSSEKGTLSKESKTSSKTISGKFTVSPNPADGMFRLTYSGKSGYLRIKNLLGQVVYAQKLPSGTTEHEILLMNQTKGVYLLELNLDGEAQQYAKLIVE